MNMVEDGVQILLVEDNPRDAELTIRALKKNNLANSLLWVKDGEEALEYFFGKDLNASTYSNPRPKLILLDLKLPKVDGMEVLNRLKNDERTKSIPVVVLTSSREEIDVLRSYELGVNSYIVKPVDFGNFSESVANLGMYWLLLNEAPGPNENH
jgi:two-component system, response regulator